MQITNFNARAIETIIGYTFRNQDLLEQAFTRSSFSSENLNVENNEVLEFIGDSVLGMLTVKHLCQRYTLKKPSADEAHLLPDNLKQYFKQYFVCELDEAELSECKISLVKRSSLSHAIEQAGLEQHLRLGKSDIIGNVQNEASVKEDLLESIIGAIAIDSNWDMPIIESVINKLIDIDSRLEEGIDKCDYEQILIEKIDKNVTVFNDTEKNELIFKEEESICESLDFGCSVTLGDNFLNQTYYGYGKTKKGAHQMAAKRAIKHFEEIKELANSVIDTVGNPNPDKAINQLQELYQKKIIPEPQYIFTQYKASETGNPQWGCICNIQGKCENAGEYIESTKALAKKNAAFDTLCALVGKDWTTFFKKYGTVTETQI